MVKIQDKVEIPEEIKKKIFVFSVDTEEYSTLFLYYYKTHLFS